MKKTNEQQTAAIRELKKFYPQLPDNLSVGGSLYLRGTQIKLSTYWILSKQIGSRDDISFYSIKAGFVVCGCFKGSIQQFEERVHNTYPEGHQHRIDYDEFILTLKGRLLNQAAL